MQTLKFLVLFFIKYSFFPKKILKIIIYQRWIMYIFVLMWCSFKRQLAILIQGYWFILGFFFAFHLYEIKMKLTQCHCFFFFANCTWNGFQKCIIQWIKNTTNYLFINIPYCFHLSKNILKLIKYIIFCSVLLNFLSFICFLHLN